MPGPKQLFSENDGSLPIPTTKRPPPPGFSRLHLAVGPDPDLDFWSDPRLSQPAQPIKTFARHFPSRFQARSSYFPKMTAHFPSRPQKRPPPPGILNDLHLAAGPDPDLDFRSDPRLSQPAQPIKTFARHFPSRFQARSSYFPKMTAHFPSQPQKGPRRRGFSRTSIWPRDQTRISTSGRTHGYPSRRGMLKPLPGAVAAGSRPAAAIFRK